MEQSPKRFTADIRPVARTRVHEEVARQLQSLMQRGVLGPGDRLPPERELAERFGVSRATVRQALSVLQAVGLIESRIGNGTFARGNPKVLSVTDLVTALRAAEGQLNEQLELRRLIEPQVASLAAERVTGVELDDLDTYLHLQDGHVSDPYFIEADSAFHLTIAKAAKNALLTTMVEGIHALLRESRERSWKEGGGHRSLSQHRVIFEAIRSRDSAAAYAAMTNHVLDVERLSLESLSQDTNPGRRPGPR